MGENNIVIEKDVYVTMPDGVRICMDIYRPKDKGKYPVLFSMGAPGKELQAMHQWMPPNRRTDHLWDGFIEAGNSVYLVSKGYIHIVADSRGSGQSEGIFGFHASDRKDLKFLMEWAAEQPWCDGNVGTFGISYYGVNSLLVTTEQPKSMKAAFLQEFVTDAYRQGQYHGGIMTQFFYNLQHGVGGDSGFVLNTESYQKMADVPEDVRNALIEKARSNDDIKHFSNLYQLCHYPQKNPFMIPVLLNDTDNEFYAGVSASDEEMARINIPVYISGPWLNIQYTLAAFDAWERIQGVPKKLLITPGTFFDRPYYELHDEILRWYDYHFKGINNGIMDEPPVKLWLSGREEYIKENEWPIARSKWTKLYLRHHNRLNETPEPMENMPPDGFCQTMLAAANEIKSITYQTEPFSRPTKVIGPMSLNIFASIDNTDTNWIAAMYDLAPDGSKTLLSMGFLRASHRALDPVKSKPYRPYHPHTKESIESIKPGKVYEYNIELIPIGHEFQKGHRLLLEIRNAESPKDEIYQKFFPGGYHLPLGKTVSHWIYQDKNRPSHLYLPFVD